MKIEPTLIARAREADLAALIGRQVKLIRHGRFLLGLCPFHREKSPSFKVENGRYHCFGCGADGDAITWLEKTDGLPFRQAVEALNGESVPMRHAVDSSPAVQRGDGLNRIREARAIWSSSNTLTGTIAEVYLRARGIFTLNPSLRYVENFPYTERVRLPAMVAGLLSPAREIVAVQVTMLNPRKPQKADVATPRRTIGVMGTGSVRLGPAGETLGLAEGVETALSAMYLTGVPTWACLGAGRMHRVFVPNVVREIHIFGDNDDPGRGAAERTATAYKGTRVDKRFPPHPALDWNDHLVAGSRAAPSA